MVLKQFRYPQVLIRLVIVTSSNLIKCRSDHQEQIIISFLFIVFNILILLIISKVLLQSYLKSLHSFRSINLTTFKKESQPECDIFKYFTENLHIILNSNYQLFWKGFNCFNLIISIVRYSKFYFDQICFLSINSFINERR